MMIESISISSVHIGTCPLRVAWAWLEAVLGSVYFLLKLRPTR